MSENKYFPVHEDIVQLLEEEFFSNFNTIEGCEKIIFDQNPDIRHGIGIVQNKLREKYPGYDKNCNSDNKDQSDRNFTTLLVLYIEELQRRLADSELERLNNCK